MTEIRIAETEEAIRGCHAVMAELRPQYDEEAFVAQVRRQMETQHYQLAYVEHDGAVSAVGGYRVIEMLAWGKALYVDDLVTSSRLRSLGHGGRLFDWLVDLARSLGCVEFHLDSGVQRFGAHRFYLAKRMDITSHHFALKLAD